MASGCFISRRCLWLAVPIVGGHLGCLALPAATIALGAPAVMPICGVAPQTASSRSASSPPLSTRTRS